MSQHLVEVVGLTQRYDGVEHPVLQDVDLVVDPGESLAVVGPSGSGKSTLLHVIGGLLPPTSGEVRIDGASLGSLDADALAQLRNQQIGFVFQAHHLLPQCTAVENALVPCLASGRAPDGAEARARELLDHVGLGHRLDHRPATLSGGECQRVAIVRALINRPSLLLADEPTGALDSESSERLADLFEDLGEREGVAIVTVTHSSDLAGRMGRVLRLSDGRLAEQGAG